MTSSHATSNRVWLTQVMRDKSSQTAFCALPDQPLDPIAAILLDGGRMDDLTMKLNKRFMDVLNGKQMSEGNKLVNLLMSSEEEDVIAESTREMALSVIEERKVPFFIPFHLLHHDASQAPNFAQFDVHERILFHGLHAWDSYTYDHRRQFVHMGLQQYADVTHADDFNTVAKLNKRCLITLLFAARGKYMTVVDNVLSSKTRPATHEDSHEDHSTNTFCCECCYDKYYMNRYYMLVFENMAAIESIKRIEDAQLKRFLNPDHLQSIIVQVLYFIWKGIATFPEDLMLDYDTYSFNVHFRLTAASPRIFTRDPAVGGQSTIPCNHQALSTRISKSFFFHTTYACIDSIIDAEQGVSRIIASFDDNNLSVLPVNDATMHARLDAIDAMMQLIAGEKDMMARLGKLITKHFPECPRENGLWYRIRWVCFDMLFNRFLNVFPELHDHSKHGKMPAEEVKRKRLQMTFALRTLPDDGWKRNEDRSLKFLEAVAQLRASCQQVVIARMCREDEKKTHQAAKSKKKHKTQQQQQTTHASDETNSTSSSSSVKDEELDEIPLHPPPFLPPPPNLDDDDLLLFAANHAYMLDVIGE